MIMKILLTGKPKSGKSTLLEEFVNSVIGRHGFLTRETRKDGERSGFQLIASSGQSTMLACVDSDSKVRVSRYGIQLDSLDKFLNEIGSYEVTDLLYIDEIGQMQLSSVTFREVVSSYLGAPNLYIGTISKVFNDSLINDILARDDIILLDLDAVDNEQIKSALMGLSKNLTSFQSLSIELKDRVARMAINYAKGSAYIQLTKLWSNTIKYLAENRVSILDSGSFMVMGNSDSHTVACISDTYSCDCDLFNGRGDYVNSAGECSHVQSVKLLSVK